MPGKKALVTNPIANMQCDGRTKTRRDGKKYLRLHIKAHEARGENQLSEAPGITKQDQFTIHTLLAHTMRATIEFWQAFRAKAQRVDRLNFSSCSRGVSFDYKFPRSTGSWHFYHFQSAWGKVSWTKRVMFSGLIRFPHWSPDSSLRFGFGLSCRSRIKSRLSNWFRT